MEKVKVLFIEDEDFLRSLFSEALSLDTTREYEVLKAQDLISGLDVAKISEPDVIILDLILPTNKAAGNEDLSEERGFEFLKKIKTDPKLKDVPIVVFSNISEPNIKNRAMELGASEYLVKVETLPQKFVETLKKVIGC
ncbi:MAG TPA: response regulator [Candidatus Wolfebacteria bacterium]|nr:response regulator [Candidatus Wolfebacteria bacterium]